jgi:formylglycine-generating enzyme required for sulfatase activity
MSVRGTHLGFVALTALLLAGRAAVAQQPWNQPGTQAGQQITGPDGGKMVWVPAGEFVMGAPPGQGNDDVHPPHRVRLSQGFWLGQCTVTNAQFHRYCQETGAPFPTESNEGDEHPVVYVIWSEASAYGAHYGLTLPTEAQWEYAARGAQDRLYPWGNDWDEQKCCNYANHGPGGRSYPVGSFPQGASWCGALDLAGNVFQWCRDWYAADYYAHAPATDPPGPDAGDQRVERGGSWYNNAEGCRSTYRCGFDPTYRAGNLGFRCAKIP